MFSSSASSSQAPTSLSVTYELLNPREQLAEFEIETRAADHRHYFSPYDGLQLPLSNVADDAMLHDGEGSGNDNEDLSSSSSSSSSNASSPRANVKTDKNNKPPNKMGEGGKGKGNDGKSKTRKTVAHLSPSSPHYIRTVHDVASEYKRAAINVDDDNEHPNHRGGRRRHRGGRGGDDDTSADDETENGDSSHDDEDLNHYHHRNDHHHRHHTPNHAFLPRAFRYTPGSRSGHSVFYVPLLDKVFLFGGMGHTGLHNDTWCGRIYREERRKREEEEVFVTEEQKGERENEKEQQPVSGREKEEKTAHRGNQKKSQNRQRRGRLVSVIAEWQKQQRDYEKQHRRQMLQTSPMSLDKKEGKDDDDGITTGKIDDEALESEENGRDGDDDDDDDDDDDNGGDTRIAVLQHAVAIRRYEAAVRRLKEEREAAMLSMLMSQPLPRTNKEGDGEEENQKKAENNSRTNDNEDGHHGNGNEDKDDNDEDGSDEGLGKHLLLSDAEAAALFPPHVFKVNSSNSNTNISNAQATTRQHLHQHGDNPYFNRSATYKIKIRAALEKEEEEERERRMKMNKKSKISSSSAVIASAASPPLPSPPLPPRPPSLDEAFQWRCSWEKWPSAPRPLAFGHAACLFDNETKLFVHGGIGNGLGAMAYLDHPMYFDFIKMQWIVIEDFAQAPHHLQQGHNTTPPSFPPGRRWGHSASLVKLPKRHNDGKLIKSAKNNGDDDDDDSEEEEGEEEVIVLFGGDAAAYGSTNEVYLIYPHRQWQCRSIEPRRSAMLVRDTRGLITTTAAAIPTMTTTVAATVNNSDNRSLRTNNSRTSRNDDGDGGGGAEDGRQHHHADVSHNPHKTAVTAIKRGLNPVLGIILPHPRRRHAAAVYKDRFVFISCGRSNAPDDNRGRGGGGATDVFLNDTWVFDAMEERWLLLSDELLCPADIGAFFSSERRSFKKKGADKQQRQQEKQQISHPLPSPQCQDGRRERRYRWLTAYNPNSTVDPTTTGVGQEAVNSRQTARDGMAGAQFGINTPKARTGCAALIIGAGDGCGGAAAIPSRSALLSSLSAASSSSFSSLSSDKSFSEKKNKSNAAVSRLYRHLLSFTPAIAAARSNELIFSSCLDSSQTSPLSFFASPSPLALTPTPTTADGCVWQSKAHHNDHHPEEREHLLLFGGFFGRPSDEECVSYNDLRHICFQHTHARGYLTPWEAVKPLTSRAKGKVGKDDNNDEDNDEEKEDEEEEDILRREDLTTAPPGVTMMAMAQIPWFGMGPHNTKDHMAAERKREMAMLRRQRREERLLKRLEKKVKREVMKRNEGEGESKRKKNSTTAASAAAAMALRLHALLSEAVVLGGSSNNDDDDDDDSNDGSKHPLSPFSTTVVFMHGGRLGDAPLASSYIMNISPPSASSSASSCASSSLNRGGDGDHYHHHSPSSLAAQCAHWFTKHITYQDQQERNENGNGKQTIAGKCSGDGGGGIREFIVDDSNAQRTKALEALLKLAIEAKVREEKEEERQRSSSTSAASSSSPTASSSSLKLSNNKAVLSLIGSKALLPRSVGLMAPTAGNDDVSTSTSSVAVGNIKRRGHESSDGNPSDNSSHDVGHRQNPINGGDGNDNDANFRYRQQQQQPPNRQRSGDYLRIKAVQNFQKRLLIEIQKRQRQEREEEHAKMKRSLLEQSQKKMPASSSSLSLLEHDDDSEDIFSVLSAAFLPQHRDRGSSDQRAPHSRGRGRGGRGMLANGNYNTPAAIGGRGFGGGHRDAHGSSTSSHRGSGGGVGLGNNNNNNNSTLNQLTRRFRRFQQHLVSNHHQSHEEEEEEPFTAPSERSDATVVSQPPRQNHHQQRQQLLESTSTAAAAGGRGQNAPARTNNRQNQRNHPMTNDNDVEVGADSNSDVGGDNADGGLTRRTAAAAAASGGNASDRFRFLTALFGGNDGLSSNNNNNNPTHHQAQEARTAPHQNSNAALASSPSPPAHALTQQPRAQQQQQRNRALNRPVARGAVNNSNNNSRGTQNGNNNNSSALLSWRVAASQSLPQRIVRVDVPSSEDEDNDDE